MTPEEARQALHENGQILVRIDGDDVAAEHRTRARVKRWAKTGGMLVTTSKVDDHIRATVVRTLRRRGTPA